MDVVDPVYEDALRAAAILLASSREARRVTRFSGPARCRRPCARPWPTASSSVAAAAIDDRGIFRVALSGGGTPKPVYPLLLEPARRDAVDWAAVEFFWGDERAVPPDHPESNFGVAYQMLIAQLPERAPGPVHRMPAEAPDLDAAALLYESELRARLRRARRRTAGLRPDLAGDGPGRPHRQPLSRARRPSTSASGGWSATGRPCSEAWRMTLTFPVLDAARRVALRRRTGRTRPMRCAPSAPAAPGSRPSASPATGSSGSWMPRPPASEAA